MPAQVLTDSAGILIRIAIKAAMQAGVIGADVIFEEAAAAGTGNFSGGKAEADVQSVLQDGLSEAAAGFDAELSQAAAFQTGFNADAVSEADFRKFLSNDEALRRRNFADAGKIPPGLFVEVNETDGAAVRPSGKFRGHFFECADVLFDGPVLRDENGIIAPFYCLMVPQPGEFPETFHDDFLIRNQRLNIFPVGGNRYGPELAEMIDLIQVRKHGSGIFGAETENIDCVRIKPVTGDALRKIGISGTDQAGLNPFEKPFTEESGNVCAHAGVDDHYFL